MDIILAVGLCLPFDFNIFPVSHSFVFVCFPFAPAVVLCHNKVSSIPVSPIVVSHPSLFCLIWLFMFHPYYWPGLVMREACYFAQRDAGPCVPWAAAYARGSALGHVRRSCDVRGICRWCRLGLGGLRVASWHISVASAFVYADCKRGSVVLTARRQPSDWKEISTCQWAGEHNQQSVCLGATCPPQPVCTNSLSYLLGLASHSQNVL